MDGVVEDREGWHSQKLDFVSSVVQNVDRSFLRDQVLQCESNQDVQILIQYLLEDGGGGVGAVGGEQILPGRTDDAESAPYSPSAPEFVDEDETNGYYRPNEAQQIHEERLTRDCSQGAVKKERPTNDSREGNAHQQWLELSEKEVEARVMEQVVSLAEIFKDADPDYLQERCWEIRGNPDRFLSVVRQMLRDKDYPKMESYFQRQRDKEIQRFFEGLSVEECEALVGDVDEEDVEAGELECVICCNDVAASDMVSCSAARHRHRFCSGCVKRFVEEEMGQGRFTFRCPEIECPGSIQERDLRTLLAPAVMDRVMQRQQLDEVVRAGLEDLESCPFCDFKVIMPNKHDKVFLCQNPACMKDSCRLCKEINHIPRSCREVLAEKQKDVRTTLENRMAEAMIRECVKCKKRFILEAGCNKMTCACGAIMCYLCKRPIEGYDHFTQYPDREPNNFWDEVSYLPVLPRGWRSPIPAMTRANIPLRR
ncbi:E3 ubiquitin-protein ligase RNF216-like isoform X2 [Macrobrachium nipponense]|uniref:E3 ubiquitin-protein ligase RNF216-like isoform X2 n=1 Tax=Macrobrachium nipponense TaxID=159736 RepID=UPI0030C858B1